MKRHRIIASPADHPADLSSLVGRARVIVIALGIDHERAQADGSVLVRAEDVAYLRDLLDELADALVGLGAEDPEDQGEDDEAYNPKPDARAVFERLTRLAVGGLRVFEGSTALERREAAYASAAVAAAVAADFRWLARADEDDVDEDDVDEDDVDEDDELVAHVEGCPYELLQLNPGETCPACHVRWPSPDDDDDVEDDDDDGQGVDACPVCGESQAFGCACFDVEDDDDTLDDGGADERDDELDQADRLAGHRDAIDVDHDDIDPADVDPTPTADELELEP